MAGGKFVAYYRVSTARQARSGLGLEAQRQAVRDYLNGGRWTLVAEYVEVESGRRNDRPELRKALAACRIQGATLVVAKFDRLSRNAAFLLTLRDSAVECIATDMPDANRLTIGIMAMIAEHEAEAISARTKAALAKSKKKLGGHPERLSRRARQKGAAQSAQVRQARAEQQAADLAPIIAELRAGGAGSLRALADGLNQRGIPTPRGQGTWSAVQIQRLLKRMPEEA